MVMHCMPACRGFWQDYLSIPKQLVCLITSVIYQSLVMKTLRVLIVVLIVVEAQCIQLLVLVVNF